MPLDVLIVQTDPTAANTLAEHFAQRGDRVRLAPDERAGSRLVRERPPQLVVVDLHLPDDGHVALLRTVREAAPRARLIATNNYPVLQREQQAKDLGVQSFLRKPFTREWLEAAVNRLAPQTGPGSAVREGLPPVRTPVRLKITLPYALLALLIAALAAFVVTRIVTESLEARYLNQLVEAGKLTADWMVAQENRQLETTRLVANLIGLPEAVAAADAETVRAMVLPIAVNNGEDLVAVLNPEGESVLTLRRASEAVEDFRATRGGAEWLGLTPVQQVLAGRRDSQGDKYAGVWEGLFVVLGPIHDEAGVVRGVVVVGRTLDHLVAELRAATLAHTTFYDSGGRPLASSFAAFGAKAPLAAPVAATALTRQAEDSVIQPFAFGSLAYREIVGPWQARNGMDLGLFGAALAENLLIDPSQPSQIQIFLLLTAAFTLVIGVGLWIANHITRPLLRVVQASSEVAAGNLEVKVEARGDDEVAVLAQSFNRMLAGLREGSLYRDLLGRTVSLQVRDQLRQTFTTGQLKLEGQEALATVLMADIRNFTGLAESASPTTIMAWLNDYFSELVPIINAYGGVVNKFDGDALLAFFGILPRAMAPEESAHLACQAALEILAAVERLNHRRAERGEPPITTGLGINTGPVAAGGLGTADRLHYTIIGDTVNVAQRLEGLTRQFGESGVVISHYTFLSLGPRRAAFQLEEKGAYRFRGKQAPLTVYRLRAAPPPDA